MDLHDFINNFVEEIRDDSIRNGETPQAIFLKKMVGYLEDLNLLVDPTLLSFYKAGTQGRIMNFDLFAFESSDNSLTLLVNDYVDDEEPGTITLGDMNTLFDRMLNFIQESFDGTAIKYIDPSSDVHKFSRQLKQRLEIDFVKLENDESIDKIKLIIVTNKKVSKRVKGLSSTKILGRSVEQNLWDIERIYELEKSGKTHEEIVIDIGKYNDGKGIPFLKADFENVEDYDAYLAIIPGKLLSDIYYEHGANLLEGNVRSFLGTKGKYNKGIQNTIKQEPDKFFIYNNGIACTASEISISEHRREIVSITDLQIINGGQTTASLSSAYKKGDSSLENIFVPMKLTIVKRDESNKLVSNIARFANSQNKVTDADFFSSHPFHVRMEKASKKLLCPSNTFNTKWYYERSRGMYLQEQFVLRTKSEIDSFVKQNPKNQVIKKEHLSKLIYSAELLRPDIVSKGSQFATNQFAKYMESNYEKSIKQFNDFYYKKIIIYAIIFRDVDKLVAQSSWYQVGGYKLNIVPYTISKIISSIPSNKKIDINRIWNDQTIYESFLEQVDVVARMVDKFIRDSGGMIVTEYAKKETTWEKFKAVPIQLLPNFIEDLMPIEVYEAEQKKYNEEIANYEIEVINLTYSEDGNYWIRLRDEAVRRKMISQEESDIITRILIPLSRGSTRVPNLVQSKKVWALRERLDNEGVTV